MGMVVRTNTMSANAYRQLGANNTQLSKSLEKLSSGYRINRAGDDSSGLAISEKMKAQIAGLEQASSNSQDGISLVQTAEGALTEVHSMLNRMVTLAEKSANGTIQNEVDRDAIQTETDALKSEITRVSQSTNFNGITLLDGSLGGTQTGAISGGVTTSNVGATVGTKAATAAVYTSGVVGIGADSTTRKLTVAYNDADGKSHQVDVSYTSVKTGPENLSAMVAALKADDTIKGQFTVTQDDDNNNIILTSNTPGTKAANVTSITTNDATATALGTGLATAAKDSESTLTLGSDMKVGDTITVGGNTYTMAAATDDTKNEFASAGDLVTALSNKGITATAAALTANTTMTFQYKTGTTGTGLKLQVGDTNKDYNQVTVKIGDMSASGLGISGLDVSTQTAASGSIDTIKTAINLVSTNRGNLGALQNRLEHAISNLDTTAENMSSANSAIRDTDMAKEMMNYTKMSILSQAAQAMLAQANQQPQNILQLLK